MNIPKWLTAAAATHGSRLRSGAATRAEAEAAIAAAIISHPEHIAGLAAAEAKKVLSAWDRGQAPAAPVQLQLPLFPELAALPAQMRVTPTRSAAVEDMTAHQLDAARNILWARTLNQMAGSRKAARAERKAFLKLYDQVRPLLAGDSTVGDALRQLSHGTTRGAA